jgi:hypothetical protein
MVRGHQQRHGDAGAGSNRQDDRLPPDLNPQPITGETRESHSHRFLGRERQHEGNTSPEDALRIYRLFNPAVWQATISVVCERDESVAAANERQRALATDFMELLAARGYSTRCFDPAGQDDIGGGCGQLWFVQDWMRQHPGLTRPSVGRGIPIVHAPRVTA